ncbi:MAG: DUF1501 domain-containing protein [Candidatus Hydrogenedentes bacterium]|nr:DUF1501 domain-containing protein [Candidatus Hydrogenedentota bacterium]
MSHHAPNIADAFLSRRDFVCRCGMGMASLGLGALLQQAGALEASNPLLPRSPHFPAKAKRVIHFFLNGGPSHVDTFDPKPMLKQYDGKPLPTPNLRTERKTGAAFASPFEFKKYGQSGIEVSEIFAKTAEHIDDIAVIRSMKAKVPNHEPSLMLMNCGDAVLSRPSMGSWITYGLGSENQNLPGFIAMCPGGYPIKEAENWQSGFLPGAFQGTYIDSQHTKLEKLIENIRNSTTSLADQRRQLDLLHELNADFAAKREEDAKLEARMQSFELAYRMQMEAADAFDIEKEPQYIRDMYGDGVHARQTLIARRLLERGVRFVQLWHGAGQPWDNHDNIEIHKTLAGNIDQPIAALITDLKMRGLFDETLILWGGEFGRTPTVELNAAGTALRGRDHNPYGFSVWLAGGGVRGGTVYGATDEFGFKAEENPLEVHDLHATMLKLLGFDHEQFTYRYAGRDFRLTDVAGHVVNDVIA